MKSDYNTTATVVWTADWPKVESPHCTVAFLGEIDKIKGKPKDILEIIINMNAAFPEPGAVDALGFDYFGDNKEFMVLKLDPARLFPARLLFMYELFAKTGITSPSQYTDYQPHLTIGKKEDVLRENPYITPPRSVKLGRMQLWWGDQIW